MPMKTKRNHRSHRSIIPVGCIILPFIFIFLALTAYFVIPKIAENDFGPASEKLTSIQRMQYSIQLLWYGGSLTRPFNSQAGDIPVTISAGDTAGQVAAKLENAGIIPSADAFIKYLIYSGLDTGLQIGDFELSPSMAPIKIAQKLQDANPTQVKFVVLPGWRLEEVAAAMPTSGLNITPDQFIRAAQNPSANYDFLPRGASAEGFLFPGEYILPRAINPDQLVALLMNHAALAFTPDLRAGFEQQNLDVFQAVTLASIVQREAVSASEQSTIASVFINRLAVGMRLDSDPTVQYSLGFVSDLNTWWKVPLTSQDLEVDSPYNTYLQAGLPPGPICSPSLEALEAVSNPEKTNYYYFRANCDNSGLHNFSETYDQHLQKGCN